MLTYNVPYTHIHIYDYFSHTGLCDGLCNIFYGIYKNADDIEYNPNICDDDGNIYYDDISRPQEIVTPQVEPISNNITASLELSLLIASALFWLHSV